MVGGPQQAIAANGSLRSRALLLIYLLCYPMVEQSALKVFISYSRKDEDFAEDLLAGLVVAGFEPYLDKRDIVAGEDWAGRLGRLIESADTVIFVISPDAVAS